MFFFKKYLPQTYIVLTKEHGQNKQTNCKQSIKNTFQKCREYATTIVKKSFPKNKKPPTHIRSGVINKGKFLSELRFDFLFYQQVLYRQLPQCSLMQILQQYLVHGS